MAITELDTRDSYVGNASTSTIYPITYKYFNTSHVTVYADGVDITNDVTFTGDGSIKTGGFQTPLVAYASSVSVVAVLDILMDQPTILTEGGPLPAKVIESGGFDRLNMQVRNILRFILNGIRTPDYEDGIIVLPDAEDRKNKVITGNATTGAIEMVEPYSPTAAEIKTLYESNANTNAFEDPDEAKLDGLLFASQGQADLGYSGVSDKIISPSLLRVKFEGGGSVFKSTTDPTASGASSNVDGWTFGKTVHSNTGDFSGYFGESVFSNTGTHTLTWGAFHSGNTGNYTYIGGFNVDTNTADKALFHGENISGNSCHHSLAVGKGFSNNSATFTRFTGEGHESNSGTHTDISGKDVTGNAINFAKIHGYGSGNQTYEVQVKGSTSGFVSIVLDVAGTGGTSNSGIIIPTDTCWHVEMTGMVVQNGTAKSQGFLDHWILINVGGTLSGAAATSLSLTRETGGGIDTAGFSVVVDKNNTAKTLDLTATGDTGLDLDWTITMRLTQQALL